MHMANAIKKTTTLGTAVVGASLMAPSNTVSANTEPHRLTTPAKRCFAPRNLL